MVTDDGVTSRMNAFDRDNAMLGGITFWEFDLLTADLRNNY